MTINELAQTNMSEGLAYLIGLTFPLLTDKEEIVDKFHNRKYVGGCVNHNEVSDEDKAIHFQCVLRLFASCDILNVTIKNNKKNPADKKDFSCTPKMGFTCLIETTGVGIHTTEEILRNRVLEIETANIDIRKAFVRGCFDGRGSWDSTLHMFSVDIDRKADEKEDRVDQFLLRRICESVIGKDSIQLNQREKDHKKNDQMRIRKNFLNSFLTHVGLYSMARTHILEQHLMELGL